MTEEVAPMPNRKGPKGLVKSRHQITYLAHQVPYSIRSLFNLVKRECFSTLKRCTTNFLLYQLPPPPPHPSFFVGVGYQNKRLL
jgi:hypothetical protein